MNEIGLVTVTAARPLVFDPTKQNRTTGSFIVIDPATNATAGAGMIVRALEKYRPGRKEAWRPPSASRAPRGRRRRRKPATDAVRRLLEEILA